MKKRMMLTLCAIFLLGSTGFCEFRFDGLGAGGQLGLVVPERDYFGSDAPALGFGFHLLAKFSLGRFGSLQYIPSVTLWYKSDRWTEFSIRYKELEGQVTINLFDVRYFPPTPDIPVKPYVGISALPCIVINTYYQEIDGREYRSWRDGEPGFNFFLGADFPIKNVVVPFVEWRMTASRKWAMRVTGGLTIWFL
jgi:hypothetical protein